MTARARRLGAAVAVAVAGAAAVVLAAGGGSPSGDAQAAESWGSLAPSPLERTEVSAARIGDRIYVVGGYPAEGGSTGAMARYDISADSWMTRAPLPIAVNHAAITAAGGRLYVLGGNFPAAGQDAKSARLYRYSPGRDRWRRLADAPTERAALGLVAIRGRLYAAGGYSETNQKLRTLEVYDVASQRWRRDGAPMPTGRNHVGAARLGATMVVTGGRPGPDHGGLDAVERYDPRRDRWTKLAPLETARSGHATVAVGGGLVAFGGEELDGGTTIEPVERYDPAADRWRPLPDMVTPRHGLGGVARRGRVYALEGGPQPGLSFSRALEYLDVGSG